MIPQRNERTDYRGGVPCMLFAGLLAAVIPVSVQGQVSAGYSSQSDATYVPTLTFDVASISSEPASKFRHGGWIFYSAHELVKGSELWHR